MDKKWRSGNRCTCEFSWHFFICRQLISFQLDIDLRISFLTLAVASKNESKIVVSETRGNCQRIGAISNSRGAPFFALWATFQSQWQPLFCPNSTHFKAIFVKVTKSFIFLVKSVLGNFYRHLATFYWSHWYLATYKLIIPIEWCSIGVT